MSSIHEQEEGEVSTSYNNSVLEEERGTPLSKEEEEYPVDHIRGYTVAFGSLFCQFSIFGIFNSFPVFADAMTKDASLGHPSQTLVSAANGFTVGMAPIFGIACGFMMDRFGPRNTLLIASLFTVLALIASSLFAHSGYQLVALYSIFGGIATGFLPGPGGAATSTWFEEKRSFAVGIAFAGGGCGSMVIPAVAGHLLESSNNDWRSTFRYMSLFSIIGFIAACFVRFRVEHHKKRKKDVNDDEESCYDQHNSSDEGGLNGEAAAAAITDGADDNNAGVGGKRRENESTLLLGDHTAEPREYSPTTEPKKTKSEAIKGTTEQDPASPLIASGTKLDDRLHRKMLKPYELVKILLHRDFQSIFWCFLCFSFAFYGILYCVVPYASSMGKEGTPYAHAKKITVARASKLFTVMGAFQIASSIGMGLMATKVKDRVVFTACCGMGAVACALWINARTFEVFAVTMVFLGVFASGAFAVIPSIVAHHFWGPNLGTMMGLSFCSMAFGGFLGPIVVTATQSAQGGSYTVAIALIGIACALSGLCCAIAIREVA